MYFESFPEEEVKLSLGIGWDSMQKGVQRGNLNDKITQLSSQHIIDLEESMETVSNDLGSTLNLFFAVSRLT